MGKKILGSKMFGHDSAIFLLDCNNKEIFAISTERVTRIKHDFYSIEPLLKEFSEKLRDVNYFVNSFSNYYDNDNCMETKANSYFYLMVNKAIRKEFKPKYIKDLVSLTPKNLKDQFKFLYKNIIEGNFSFSTNLIKNHAKYKVVKNNFNNNKKYVEKIYYDFVLPHLKNKPKFETKEHHLSHSVSSYYFSPYQGDDSLSLVLDGQGDGLFSSLWEFKKSLQLPNLIAKSESKLLKNRDVVSIGHIYTKFTAALGFTPNSDEGKTEALAAYGKSDKKLRDMINKAFFVDDNLEIKGDSKILEKLYSNDFLLLQISTIGKENFAATIQIWLEDFVVSYLNMISIKFPKIKNLTLSGGVSANVIMNLNIYGRTNFKNLFIFPAMGDEGCAAGAAILKAIDLGEDLSWLKDKIMPYWGPNISLNEIEIELSKKKWKNLIKSKNLDKFWMVDAAKSINNGEIIAICHGNMEFGPRALGNRSIVANPLLVETRDKINSTVKRRPSFQPFCPSVLEDERERLFLNTYKHKHMATAFRIKEEFSNLIPCATHIDGTARPQFIEKNDNPQYYELIKEFKKLSGYGIVINTSFNLHGRTIVRTAEDAIVDFIDCNIDKLYLEGYLIELK